MLASLNKYRAQT